MIFFWVCSVQQVSLRFGTQFHGESDDLGKTTRFGIASLIQSQVTSSSSSTGENNSNAYLFLILLQLNIYMGLAHFHDFGYVD